MTDHDDQDAFDAALRQHLQGDAEPDDAGFSLRVMAALPPPAVSRRYARRLRRMQWVAISLAACGAATLLGGTGQPPDLPHTLAGLALLALLLFWAIPSRWSRG